MELPVFFGGYTSTSSKGVHYAQLLVVVAVLAIGSAVALSQTTSANPEESILKLTFKQILPKVKLIYLTMNQDPDLAAEPFRLGASGYIVKNSAATELVYGIREVLRGRSYITALMTREMVGSFLQNIERKKNPNQLTLRQKKRFFSYWLKAGP